MQAFKDSEGRDWLIRITADAVTQVKARLGVYLPGLLSGGAVNFAELTDDLCRFVNVLYVLCEEQCQARGLSDRDFGRSLGGDSIEQAAAAFMEDLIDFFPKSRRPLLRELWNKAREAERLAENRTAQKISGLDPSDPESWKNALSGQSGSTPASSASTPDASP